MITNDTINIALRKNLFSLEHIDRTIKEGASVSQMIQEIGFAPIAEVHGGVFIYVGESFDRSGLWDDMKLVRIE